MPTVLVTGGSGFIAGHTILQLLAAGHTVRTTVRNLAREPEVRATLENAGARPDAPLTFFTADLEKDAGWHQAAVSCDSILHIASPFPSSVPKDPNELIRPARDGALRVLRAARDAGVRRVVLTSSFAAIGYGHPAQSGPFTEDDWTDPASPDALPYVQSKTLAERAAWDFVARDGGSLELAVVNPVGVFGPVLSGDLATSVLIIQRMLQGALPGLPKLWFGAVDVRDVASLHLLAMTSPAARGERFLAVAGDFLSMLDIATVLRAHFGPVAAKVPTRQFPNWLVRLAALRDRGVKQILPELDKRKNATNAKAHRLLGWQPRSADEAVIATAESLIRLNLVTPPANS
ncbi:MAG TPA: aldehyde reductase [Acidobacteriaceae bacterium]|nr:aldehyde reductase [Acidobacteriaceae bacterium]